MLSVTIHHSRSPTMVRRLVATLGAILANVVVSSNALACKTTIQRSDGNIAFVGCLSQPSVGELTRLLAADRAALLTLNSEGGDVEAALKLAHWLLAHPRPVAFRGRCHSSCANYVLPAASPGLLDAGVSIVLHGDATTTSERIDGSSAPGDLRRELQRISQAERSFRSRSERAEWLHQLQRVAFANRTKSVQVDLGTHRYRCAGWGVTAFEIHPAVLVGRSPHWKSIGSPQATSRSEGDPAGQVRVTEDPLAACTRVR